MPEQEGSVLVSKGDGYITHLLKHDVRGYADYRANGVPVQVRFTHDALGTTLADALQRKTLAPADVETSVRSALARAGLQLLPSQTSYMDTKGGFCMNADLIFLGAPLGQHPLENRMLQANINGHSHREFPIARSFWRTGSHCTAEEVEELQSQGQVHYPDGELTDDGTILLPLADRMHRFDPRVFTATDMRELFTSKGKTIIQNLQKEGVLPRDIEPYQFLVPLFQLSIGDRAIAVLDEETTHSSVLQTRSPVMDPVKTSGLHRQAEIIHTGRVQESVALDQVKIRCKIYRAASEATKAVTNGHTFHAEGVTLRSFLSTERGSTVIGKLLTDISDNDEVLGYLVNEKTGRAIPRDIEGGFNDLLIRRALHGSHKHKQKTPDDTMAELSGFLKTVSLHYRRSTLLLRGLPSVERLLDAFWEGVGTVVVQSEAAVDPDESVVLEQYATVLKEGMSIFLAETKKHSEGMDFYKLSEKGQWGRV
ncbi:MAG: hypothetical protein JWM56_1424 [Candidatus Peribacteria bacterium]|nr:hypothetical protein [Candidatus Peribacteria bacterium]